MYVFSYHGVGNYEIFFKDFKRISNRDILGKFMEVKIRSYYNYCFGTIIPNKNFCPKSSHFIFSPLLCISTLKLSIVGNSQYTMEDTCICIYRERTNNAKVLLIVVKVALLPPEALLRQPTKSGRRGEN